MQSPLAMWEEEAQFSLLRHALGSPRGLCTLIECQALEADRSVPWPLPGKHVQVNRELQVCLQQNQLVGTCLDLANSGTRREAKGDLW